LRLGVVAHLLVSQPPHIGTHVTCSSDPLLCHLPRCPTSATRSRSCFTRSLGACLSSAGGDDGGCGRRFGILALGVLGRHAPLLVFHPPHTRCGREIPYCAQRFPLDCRWWRWYAPPTPPCPTTAPRSQSSFTQYHLAVTTLQKRRYIYRPLGTKQPPVTAAASRWNGLARYHNAVQVEPDIPSSDDSWCRMRCEWLNQYPGRRPRTGPCVGSERTLDGRWHAVIGARDTPCTRPRS
jgi:hypothetical protein